MLDNRIYQMSTSTRHGSIVDAFIGYLFKEMRNNKLQYFREEIPLVHEGGIDEYEQGISTPLLIDLEQFSGIELIAFMRDKMNKMNFVQPDFMVFKKFSFIENTKGTRIAGTPDLIVEVWSPANTPREKQFKKELYGSFPNCEHWYIEQDRNEVQCYLGRNKLPDQNLQEILRSQDGMAFDLTYLSLKDVEADDIFKQQMKK